MVICLKEVTRFPGTKGEGFVPVPSEERDKEGEEITS